jgi:hypothetical protein
MIFVLRLNQLKQESQVSGIAFSENVPQLLTSAIPGKIAIDKTDGINVNIKRNANRACSAVFAAIDYETNKRMKIQGEITVSVTPKE